LKNRVFLGHRVNGSPSASLRIAPLEVSVRRLFPQSPEMDSSRRNTRLQAVGFRGLRVLGCGSHRFELTGRGSRLRVFVVRLLGSAGAPPSPDSSLGRRSWRIGSSWVQRAASGPVRIEAHLTDPLFPVTLSLGSLPLSPGLSLTLNLSLSVLGQKEERRKKKKREERRKRKGRRRGIR